MAAVEVIQNNKRLCACGKCGELIDVYYHGWKSIPRRFVQGHNTRLHPKGENHPSWKGGRIYNLGYWLVLCKDHPRADKRGYVREHILAFEAYHKCRIPKWGVVHHINHITTDNRIENLQGMTRREHTGLHATGRKQSEEFREKNALGHLIVDMNDRVCSICGSKKTTKIKTVLSGLRPRWYIDKETGLFICETCRARQRNKEIRIKKLATVLLLVNDG